MEGQGSVKSDVVLKKRLGLFFLDMIKTTHRHFPKKFLQDVEITERGGHFIVVSSKDGVSLSVVGWNDDKKGFGTRKKRKSDVLIQPRNYFQCFVDLRKKVYCRPFVYLFYVYFCVLRVNMGFSIVFHQY